MAEDAAKLERIISEVGELEAPTTTAGGTAAGDSRRRRPRDTIIRALDDAPPGLEELRAVLMREHVGRVRDGLVD